MNLKTTFFFPNGLRTTDPLATLTNLIKVHNFNLIDIRKVFHFTGSHVWIPKQSVCLIVCRNMGILAVAVPDFKYIYSSENRKAVAAGSFIFPPHRRLRFWSPTTEQTTRPLTWRLGYQPRIVCWVLAMALVTAIFPSIRRFQIFPQYLVSWR